MSRARTALRIARELRPELAAYGRELDRSTQAPGTVTSAELGEARRRTDEARALLVYLVRHLADRHTAALLARACHAPGVICQR